MPLALAALIWITKCVEINQVIPYFKHFFFAPVANIHFDKFDYSAIIAYGIKVVKLVRSS